MLESYSYEGVLERGYAIVRDGKGNPIARAQSLKPGQALGIQFADGNVDAVAAGSAKADSDGKAKKPSSKDGGQGDLF